MARHVNIPIFIPHLGCPNLCVFCNQKTISGVDEFKIEKVKLIIDEALSTISPETECEIAFFGGSFTGIDRDMMVSLLKISKEYIDSGKVASIRCSTRPDYINEEILNILEEHGVKTIELGLQSSSDKVLRLTKRGHTFSDEEKACRLIVERGFSLVGQMMIGLPGSTLEEELQTAEFIIKSGAKAARIYPTVVFKNTELCNMTCRGEYKPLEIQDTIRRSAAVLWRFYESKINVIRIGLCTTENLTNGDSYFAGPNHAALGELVENELFYVNIKQNLFFAGASQGDSVTVRIARGATSKACGQKKKNKNRLLSDFSLSNICFVESDELCGYDIQISIEERIF